MPYEMSENEFSYIVNRLAETYTNHERFQQMYIRETGRRWVPEIRIFPPDTGIKTHLQKDEGGG